MDSQDRAQPRDWLGSGRQNASWAIGAGCTQMRRKMHKVINNFAEAARKGCQNILAWLCSDLARPLPPAPLLHRQSAGPEPRMHLGASSPCPPAAQPAPRAAASACAAPLQSPPSIRMGNPEVHPARRCAFKKLEGFPLAWIVFGGATSPLAPPAIWTASASSVSIQYFLHGRQEPPFSKGQLCTLSLQRRVACTSDPSDFSRGGQTPAFSPMSTWHFAEQPWTDSWSRGTGCAEWGWTASAACNSTEIKAMLPPAPHGTSNLVPEWGGRRGRSFRGFIREKEASAFLSFNWQLQLEKSYRCLSDLWYTLDIYLCSVAHYLT